jgi:hypothetical protein
MPSDVENVEKYNIKMDQYTFEFITYVPSE